MKKWNVILDFTSLLDVTLIIIFFFIICSYYEGEENKNRTNEAVKSYEIAIKDAEKREEDASLLAEQLEQEIEIVQASDERQAQNAKEILEYNRGGNVKIILDMRETGWSVRVIRNSEVIAVVDKEEQLELKLVEVLKGAGYAKEDTIFCEFILDGSLPGTASAYRELQTGFEELSKTFKYLYISETDISIGGN